MLEAAVAAELLQKGLLGALKVAVRARGEDGVYPHPCPDPCPDPNPNPDPNQVAVREEWAPERSGGRQLALPLP